MKLYYTTFDCFVNDPLNNSYEMILQYCLSVYAVNLFSSPHFTTFKIRIINQQSGDCNDSKILNANNLDSNAFPVLIKVKGGQRLLVKVKLIGFTSTSAEKDIGQGVSSFDKNSIDNSLRVPIYDKTKGVEQVAICSLDMFLSGFQLQKNVSGTADKSKSKIEDWRDRSEDVAFSQMSYTVESENEERELQNENQISQKRQVLSGKKFTSSELESFQGNKQPKNVKYAQGNDQKKQQRREFHEEQPMRKKIQHQKDQQKGFDFNQRAKNPLQNDSSISDTELNMKLQLSLKQQSSKSGKKQQLQRLYPLRNNQQSLESSSEEQKLEINESINPDSIRERLKENENLMQKLRTYLARSMEKQTRTIDFRPSNHKIRRRKVKIQEFSNYVSSKPHVKYHVEQKENRCKVISQFKAFKHSKSELKDESEAFQSLPLERVVIYSAQNQKLVSFDALSYRSSCIINEVQNTSPKINIPDNQTSLKVKVTLENYGDFEGVLGVQEGENMTIELLPCQNINSKCKLIVNREYFQFSFSIGKKTLIEEPLKEEMGQEEVSLREPEYLFEKEDIRSRIKSLSMQPWGYGQSHLLGLTSKLPDGNKQKNKSVSLKKQFKDNSSKQQTPMKYLDQEQLSLQDEKISRNRFQTSSFPETDSYNKSFSNSSSIKQTAKKSSPSRKDICLLRNGNRNNFKFKDRRRSRQKQFNIKEMWQKLLIRKKIEEEEETEKQEIYNTRKQLETVISFKKKTKPQQRVKTREHQTPKNNLYGCVAGSKEVMRVSEHWPGQLGGEADPFPLRSVTVEIKNISITQPQIVIDQEETISLGKFVKLTMKGKVTYFTEIIFNGVFNSILWKLSGCRFKDLLGNEKLTIQIYQTLQNKIDLIGKASIRTSKLYFLRNNHIYNGKILLDDTPNGEFTLGFEIQEHCPFEVILEEEGEESRMQHSPSPFLQTKVTRTKSDQRKKTKMFLQGGPGDMEGSAQRKAVKQSGRERGLSGTLKKERRRDKEEVYELSRSKVLPGGIQGYQQ